MNNIWKRSDETQRKSAQYEHDRVSQSHLISEHDQSKNDHDEAKILNENALHEVNVEV